MKTTTINFDAALKKPMTDKIELGVKLLNDTMPGWYRQIDMSTFNMSEDNKCIIGQLWGPFTKAPFLEGKSNMYKLLFCVSHGLSMPRRSKRQDWDHLTLMWSIKLESLQADSPVKAFAAAVKANELHKD